MLYSSPTAKLAVPLPSLGICDVHARFDASGLAWLGVYCRQTGRWYTTSDRTCSVELTTEVLALLVVPS